MKKFNKKVTFSFDIIWQPKIKETKLSSLFNYGIIIFGPGISVSIFENLDFGAFSGPTHLVFKTSQNHFRFFIKLGS